MDSQRPEPTRETNLQANRQRAKHPEERHLLELPAPFRYSTANQACWYLGAFLLAAGLVGFVVPGLFFAHLNRMHNFILVFTGLGSLLLGLGKPDYIAKKICYWLGSFYTLMGIAGFAFGVREISLTRPTVTGVPVESSFLWKLIPGRFELGAVDHSVHLVVGLLFLVSAYFTLQKHRTSKDVTWH